jgi:hypothetical protein
MPLPGAGRGGSSSFDMEGFAEEFDSLNMILGRRTDCLSVLLCVSCLRLLNFLERSAAPLHHQVLYSRHSNQLPFLSPTIQADLTTSIAPGTQPISPLRVYGKPIFHLVPHLLSLDLRLKYFSALRRNPYEPYYDPHLVYHHYEAQRQTVPRPRADDPPPCAGVHPDTTPSRPRFPPYVAQGVVTRPPNCPYRGFLQAAYGILQETRLWGAGAPVEVSFEGERGTGDGPTLEFFHLLAVSLKRADLGLWRDTGIRDRVALSSSEGIPVEMEILRDRGEAGVSGLFLRPLALGERTETARMHMQLLGWAMARALLDRRCFDLCLSPVLLGLLLKQPSGSRLSPQTSRETLALVDPGLASSMAKLEALAKGAERGKGASKKRSSSSSAVDPILPLAITPDLPGYPHVRLFGARRGGLLVTRASLPRYIRAVLDWTLGEGISWQVGIIQNAFSEVLGARCFSTLGRLFSPVDFSAVLSGESPSGALSSAWTIPALTRAIHADHGYTLSSPIITHLVTVLSGLVPPDRALFLRFLTGSGTLPLGGWSALTPPFTVVRRDPEPSSAARASGSRAPALLPLPSVSCCTNYLKLPAYPTLEVLRERLLFAIRDGQNAFHLS